MNIIEKLIVVQKKQAKNEKLIHIILCIYVLLSMFTVSFIKLYVRKQHFELHTRFDYLQGTLPNFFAATGLCGLIFFYVNLLNKKSTYKHRLLFASIFTFAGLTVWEYIQYFMGYPIDYNDILMSFIGCTVTIVFVLFLKRIFHN